MPTQDGTGRTWNFQLHPAFWLGMALCDNQSAPEFTHAPCTPDSDANIFDGTNPAGPDYIGKHPGTAFLELQFYPPGWAPWPPGVSCDATKWCAAMAIFSLLQDQNAGTLNNDDCRDSAGDEPANFAFITTSGVPHAPPCPLAATAATFTPNAATDLFMNSGRPAHDRHPRRRRRADGDHPRPDDTGETGSMTASAANGFAQVLLRADRARLPPVAVHVPPDVRDVERAHACPVGRAQLQRRVLGRDRPLRVLQRGHRRGGDCTATARPRSTTTTRAASTARSRSLVKISGCIASDTDFDGTSYQNDLAGDRPRTGRIPSLDLVHEPALQRDRELLAGRVRGRPAADRGARLRRHLRPLHRRRTASTRRRASHSTRSTRPGRDGLLEAPTAPRTKASCVWQLGGADIKGTTNTFGGNSAAEFGPLLFSFYPNPNPAIRLRTNNFRNVLGSNPCPA